MFCFLRLHHVSDYWRRAAGTAAASQEGEEEGEDTSRSVRGFLSRSTATQTLLLCNVMGRQGHAHTDTDIFVVRYL